MSGMTEEQREYHKAYRKEYYQNNKDSFSEKAKEWRKNNKAVREAIDKKYRENNRDSIKASNKQYRKINKDIRNAKNRKYYQNNKDRIIAKAKEEYQNNPVVNLRYVLRARVYGILKGYKSAPTLELVGIADKDKPLEFLWQYVEKQFKPGMTRENHGKWHIDISDHALLLT